VDRAAGVEGGERGGCFIDQSRVSVVADDPERVDILLQLRGAAVT
jgi:hypothetical protein